MMSILDTAKLKRKVEGEERAERGAAAPAFANASKVAQSEAAP